MSTAGERATVVVANADETVCEVLGVARSHHYFDPCELLVPDARSELRPEHRRRQRGGGWEKV